MNAIVLCGFMGCGKTTVGELTAQTLEMDYVDADQYIQEKAGMTISQMFDLYGEDYFRDREHTAMRELSSRKNIIISSGGGALTYQRNVAVVREAASIVYIQAEFFVCYHRIAEDTRRPLVMSNTRESLEALYNRRDGLYRACADAIISNNTTPEESVKTLCAWIKQQ